MLKTRFGAKIGRVWGSLERHLGGSWDVLGASWRLLGASWAPLGHFLGARGRLLAGLGRFLAAFRLPGTPWTLILEGWGTCRARFWKIPGACFSMVFAAPRTSLHNAFVDALNHSLAFTLAFLFSPAARRYVRSTWNWLLKPQKTSMVAHFDLLKLKLS